MLSGTAVLAARADDAVPTGFKPDRYQTVWERNPFTLVTPTIAAVRTTPFDKLILVSWLNDGGKDVVFVQNTDTSEVQKITSDPNPNNLKLVEIHKNPDPQKAEVVLSNGAEQGSVKFRLDAPPASPQAEGGQPRRRRSKQVPGLSPGDTGPACTRNVAPNAIAAKRAATGSPRRSRPSAAAPIG